MILGNDLVSVTLIRHMLWKMLGADHPMEAHKIDSRGVYHRGRSTDAFEGVSPFFKSGAVLSGKVSRDLPEFFLVGHLPLSNKGRDARAPT